jgi:putative peptidoglycan lipid II flippase
MSQMLKSSGAMAAATMTSRVLGMLREMAYASFMGVGWVTDAFMLAFMVPNLFRRLLGEGALTTAFIPVFKEKEKQAGEAQMWRAANAVISGLIAATAVIIALGMIGITFVLPFVNPAVDGQTYLMLRLLRLMFPYVLLVCLAAVLMAMLNARGHFFVPALGAALINVVMIASVFVLAPLIGGPLHRQIFGLAIGVVIAGIVQAGFQWPALRREGFRYRWVTPWTDETVQHVVRQMIPSAVGVAAFQINVLLTQGLAFWVGEGIVSSFGYAVRLLELPQGVFGISLATYLLPTLSGLAAEKNYDEFRATLRQGLGYLVTVNLVASVFLLVLGEPMVRLIFERGKFDAAATANASLALRCLAPGLVMFSMVNILARAFYALGDMRTPMRISVFCLTLNLVLAVALVWRFQQGGLGLANTLSATCNAVLLLYALRRKLPKLELLELRKAAPALLAAAIATGFTTWGAWRIWEEKFGHANLWARLGEVFVPLALGSAIYLGLAAWRRVPYVKEILSALPIKRTRNRS